MKLRPLLLVICVCMVFCVAAALSAADMRWKVTRLDDRMTYVSEINSRGQIVGGVTTESGWNSHAALMKNGNIKVLTSTLSDGWAVNNKGIVAGCVRARDGYPTAAFWDGKKCTLLPGLGGAINFAYSVNDLDEIVGECDDGWRYQAVCWKNGELTVLEDLAGLGAYAEDINNLSHIIGNSWDEKRDHQAVLWRDGQITNIGALWQNSWSRASAINDHDVVVGTRCSYAGWITRAYVYQDGDWYDLPSPYGMSVGPTDINNLGQIIGCVWFDNEPQAVLWYEGEMIYLDDYCTDPGWEIDYPRSINNRGEIIAEAKYNGEWCYCLLSPVKSK